MSGTRPTNNVVIWLLCLGMLSWGSGCASRSASVKVDQSQEPAMRTPATEERVTAAPLKEIPPADSPIVSSRVASPPDLPAERPTQRYLLDIPFDFDQSSLRLDAIAMVEANARRLKEDGVKKVLLEGRADEIGTSEYNLVLGERRARGVKLYLESLGLVPLVIDTTSYGKDRPLCTQHSAECWQKNRSVRFVVRE
jgi:peptidoglycan-associated lipoprotein